MRTLKSLLLHLLPAFALGFPMENSQADKSISAIQAVPGSVESFINLIPNDAEEAIQVSFETAKKFKFIESMLEDVDFEESEFIHEIPFLNINNRTLNHLVKYAKLESFLDHLRYLLFNIVLILLVTLFCSMNY